MGCASKRNQYGFTLVEISIVMIIIGLLIGGTFGGMKLIENMQVNKTVQDLKAIESAALTFKDTYGRLPGDIVNPAARLPNCTVAPCSTGGNGNRLLDEATLWSAAMVANSERFTFWHHLQAADLLSVGVNNTTIMDFGEGQPSAPIEGGFRISHLSGSFGPCPTIVKGGIILIASDSFAAVGTTNTIMCSQLYSLDKKMDDGRPFTGRFSNSFSNGGCVVSAGTCDTEYNIVGSGVLYGGIYDAAF